jgi:tRNA threonylcarbamoyladenosine biosynthesis protein TsaB
LIVLGLDTATWTAAVGLSQGESVLAEAAEPAARSHVASLPALVQRVLRRAGLVIGDVQGVAVSIGPGSFTGLRIGLGLAKGLAFAGNLPLAAVPTLEALASAAEAMPGETVCAALDARKREVYAALFRIGADGSPHRLGADEALAPDALAARLPAGTVLIGDAADAYPSVFGPALISRPFATHHPRGGIVARLGARLLAAGSVADVGTVEPAYVRPPEAEVAREPGPRDAPERGPSGLVR